MNKDQLTCRRGKFNIAASMFETHPEIVMQVFGNIIITAATRLMGRDVYQYEGISPLFDVIADSEPTPIYDLKAEGKDGKIEIIASLRRNLEPIRRRDNDLFSGSSTTSYAFFSTGTIGLA